MTKKEKQLCTELREEISALIRQYTLFIDTRELLLKELRELRTENRLLKASQQLNGHCYFQRESILPFKWRG